MSTNNEARIWAAVIRGMESEGIRPVQVRTMYNVMFGNYNIRIDHIPTGTVVAHYIESRDMDLPLDKLAAKIVDPLVMKMLEALTS